MLSETIAELERLEKAMNDGSLPVSARACYRWDLTTALRTHARALLAAAKLSEARAMVCEAAKLFIENQAGEGYIRIALAALAAAEKGAAEGGSK